MALLCCGQRDRLRVGNCKCCHASIARYINTCKTISMHIYSYTGTTTPPVTYPNSIPFFHSTTRTLGSSSECIRITWSFSLHQHSFRGPSVEYRGDCTFLSLLWLEMPKLCAKATFCLIQTSVKCLLHSPFCTQVRLTCLTHFT